MLDIFNDISLVIISNIWVTLLFGVIVNIVFVGFLYSIINDLFSSMVLGLIPLNVLNVVLTISSGFLFNSELIPYAFYPLWLSAIFITMPFLFIIYRCFKKEKKYEVI